MTSDAPIKGLLLILDILTVIVVFNTWHWLITGHLDGDLLLTWKLLLVVVVACVYNYTMDLYSFHSPLSKLGIAERSFIAMLLTGLTVAVIVYLIGPDFIGGFVGRGVLASSLFTVWLLSLSWRWLLEKRVLSQQARTQWLLLTDGDVDWFLHQFHEVYPKESLLILARDESQAPTLDDQSRLAGSWDDMESVMKTETISGLILAAHDLPRELLDRLMSIRIAGTRVHKLNDFYEQNLARVPVFHVDQNWIATSSGFNLIHNPLGLKIKRYLDLLVALLGLVLSIPFMFFCTLLILLVSGRPVLYKQIRTGENSRPIRMYKFRTMVKEAEKDGAQFAEKDDPRLIPFGSTMRKFRLDELPQFYNILKGEMSFIGPRPERPEFIEDLQKEIPYYNLRHLVKPGLTGWAQVMHGYGDSTESAVEKLQYDLFYIKNYSLLLDISIVLKSLKVILFGTGR